MTKSTKSLPTLESIAARIRWYEDYRPYIRVTTAPLCTGMKPETIRVAIPMSDDDDLAMWEAARLDKAGRVDPEKMPRTIWILSPHGHIVDVPTEEWAAAVDDDVRDWDADESSSDAIEDRLCPAGRHECCCGAAVWMEI